ncbi:hypothetical protein B0H14DRAFT_2557236 [Mycena olivaceomarginata]|nr:hypothetical protein B0H14DRAFT_2557236 [Mycena olivaceomarginata]
MARCRGGGNWGGTTIAERCVGFPGVVSDFLKIVSDFLNAVSLAVECVGFPDPCVAVSGFVYTQKPSSPVKVVMGEAEHASYMLFKKSCEQPTSSSGLLPPKTSDAKGSTRAIPSKSSFPGSGSSTIGPVPVPTWNAPNAGGSRKAAEDEEMDDSRCDNAEHTGDTTATEGSSSLNIRQPGSPSKSATNAGGSPRKRKRSDGVDSATPDGTDASAVRFDSSQDKSPSKKRKEKTPELHVIDVKTCSELPDVCEVMDTRIQDAMMKPIYELPLPRLKKGQVTTWSSSEGPGMFELSYYPVINPQLSIDTVWALLLFVRKSVYINPARIDPRLLEARSPHYIKDGPKKRWVMSIDEKPAICVSIVNCVQSSLEQVSTVGQAASPLIPLLKFITGVHLSQDFERIVGLCAMVFQLELMHVQLHMSALTFGTKGIPIEQYENLESKSKCPGVKSSGNIYKKNTYVPSNDSLNWNDHVPVYDGRFTSFDAAVNIDNLDKILPVYDGDIPTNCCTAVGYTISHYGKYNAQTRAREDHISFNLQWAVVLGEPDE